MILCRRFAPTLEETAGWSLTMPDPAAISSSTLANKPYAYQDRVLNRPSACRLFGVFNNCAPSLERRIYAAEHSHINPVQPL